MPYSGIHYSSIWKVSKKRDIADVTLVEPAVRDKTELYTENCEIMLPIYEKIRLGTCSVWFLPRFLVVVNLVEISIIGSFYIKNFVGNYYV